VIRIIVSSADIWEQRNISLSIINLQPVAKFSELHVCPVSLTWSESLTSCGLGRHRRIAASLVSGATYSLIVIDRLPTAETYVLHYLFTGYSMVLITIEAAKRPADTPNPERTPDPKRARLSHPHPSEAPPRQTPITAPPPAPTIPPIPQLSMGGTPQQFLEAIRQADKNLHILDQAIKDARAKGDNEQVERLTKERGLMLVRSQRGKAALAALKQSQLLAAQNAAANGEGQKPSLAQPYPLPMENVGGTRTTPVPPSLVPFPPQQGVPSSHGMQVPTQQSVSPQMAAQMQKMMARPSSSHPLPPQQQKQQQPQSGMLNVGKWQGILSWTGFDAATQGRKEVHAQVIATPQEGADL
jgi:hypothetical protein